MCFCSLPQLIHSPEFSSFCSTSRILLKRPWFVGWVVFAVFFVEVDISWSYDVNDVACLDFTAPLERVWINFLLSFDLWDIFVNVNYRGWIWVVNCILLLESVVYYAFEIPELPCIFHLWLRVERWKHIKVNIAMED